MKMMNKDRDSRQISKKDRYLVEVHHSIWWVAVLVCSGTGSTQHPATLCLNSPPGRVATHRSCKAQMWIVWISHSKGWRCRSVEVIEAMLQIMHDWNQQKLTSNLQWCCWLLGFFSWFQVEDLVGFTVVNNESCQWCLETSSEKYLHGRTRHTDEYEMVCYWWPSFST